MHDNVQPTTHARSQDDEQAAVRRSVDAQYPAVAQFLAEDRVARPDADLMRVDAPQVSQADEALKRARALDAYRKVFTEQQTHVIRLLDSPGATLTVVCPDWCEDDHLEAETHGTFLEDFAHRGAEEALHVDLGDGGHEDVLLVEITQYPFGRDMRQPTAILWPTLGMTEGHLTPDGLAALGEQLRQYANDLIGMSIRLAEIRRGNR
ncbi:DUF6907 domain-containing protein [Streptomyces chartreusis]|uniref:DUF6907 domain-containing protein n=1 Tax=Streptomyces chartreusis TaxID=1969 RepID=UPI0033E166B9